MILGKYGKDIKKIRDVMNQPILLLMAGLPGSGKTTIALRLGNLLNWVVLDKDTFNTTLITVHLEREQSALLAYDLLFSLAYDLLFVQKFSVILDMPSYRQLVLERSLDLAQKADAKFKIIQCVASEKVLTERLAKRNAKPSQIKINASPSDYRFDHLPENRLILQTDSSLDDNIIRAMEYLRMDSYGHQ
jgi:predicted kinase